MFSKKKENIKPGRKLVPSEDSPPISSTHKPRQPLSRFVSSLRRMISENSDSDIWIKGTKKKLIKQFFLGISSYPIFEWNLVSTKILIKKNVDLYVILEYYHRFI